MGELEQIYEYLHEGIPPLVVLEQIYLHERNSPWVSWNRSISMKEFTQGELEQIYLHEGIPPG